MLYHSMNPWKLNLRNHTLAWLGQYLTYRRPQKYQPSRETPFLVRRVQRLVFYNRTNTAQAPRGLSTLPTSGIIQMRLAFEPTQGECNADQSGNKDDEHHDDDGQVPYQPPPPRGLYRRQPARRHREVHLRITGAVEPGLRRRGVVQWVVRRCVPRTGSWEGRVQRRHGRGG
jgi:hypothetical protein